MSGALCASLRSGLCAPFVFFGLFDFRPRCFLSCCADTLAIQMDKHCLRIEVRALRARLPKRRPRVIAPHFFDRGIGVKVATTLAQDIDDAMPLVEGHNNHPLMPTA